MSEAGSQTVNTHQDDSVAISDAFEAFGIPMPGSEENDAETETESAESANETQDAGDDAPATEQTETVSEQPKKLVVKFNKQEIEVDEAQIPELVQKGLALDKERERKSEYQRYLDEVAKLQGYKDHEDLIANLEKIKAETKQREEDQFRQLREDLRQQAEDAGLDPEKVEQFIENHPLMKEARRIKAENEERAKIEQQLRQQQEIERQWTELYQAFPELIEDAKAWTRGETPSFYTPEMQALVERGYHPLHAYKLAHMDKLTTQAKELARQAAIKEQMLNKRSQVETDTGGDMEPEVPEELKEAFALFGLDPKLAKKYAKR